MELLVKLVLKILAIIIVVLLAAVLALVLLFDLNMLKPRIESVAREQGVDLQIRGDLGWTFWPSIGISVEDIRVAAVAAPDQPIAQLKQASLLVAFRPLFSGNIEVDHVRVDGAVINLAVDQQGTGNWEALTQASAESAPDKTTVPDTSSGTPATAPDVKPDESTEFNLAVERISLMNSSLNYRDEESGQRVAVEDIQLDIRQFNLQGEPFDMALALKTTLTDEQQPENLPLSVVLDIKNRVQLAPEFESAQLSDGEIKVIINRNGKFSVRYNLKLDDLQEDLRYSGKVEVPVFNARALLTAMGTELETSQSYALATVGLTAAIVGDAKQLVLEPLTLKLDKTTIEGRVAVTDFTASAIQVVLNGDEINIDDYLAPPAPKSQTEPAADGDEELIPLETIRELNADVRADFAKVTLMEMPIENIQLHVVAKNGLVNLQQGNAGLYQGNINTTGSLDGRGETAVIKMDGKIGGVQLAPALKDLELDEKIQISGAINADATASLRGVTMNQLMSSLVGEANFSGAEIRVAPINIEQKFCQLINLVNQTQEQQGAWENYTEMRELTGKARIAQQVLTVESFNAGVHQLVLGLHGNVNIAASTYDFTLPLKLLDEESSENGCRVNSNYWVNRSLSLLRCRGSLDALNPVSDCRPDSDGLKSLTKDLLEFKLREKHGDKIDALEQKADDKKDELRKKLDEKIGTETEGKKPRDLLKGLINKQIEKKSTPKAEPEPESVPEATPESAAPATEATPEDATTTP
jgi:AsmA protein